MSYPAVPHPETGGHRNGNTWRLQLARRLTVHPDVLTEAAAQSWPSWKAAGSTPTAATVGMPQHLHRAGAELPDQPLLIRLANRLAVDPRQCAQRPRSLTAGTG